MNNKQLQILLTGGVSVTALVLFVWQFFSPKGTITAECVVRAPKKKSALPVAFELIDIQHKQSRLQVILAVK